MEYEQKIIVSTALVELEPWIWGIMRDRLFGERGPNRSAKHS